MDLGGDTPNDFFSQLQPFIDESTGAVRDRPGRSWNTLK